MAVAPVIVIESASNSTTDEDKQLLCKLASRELYICVHVQRCFSWGVVMAINIFWLLLCSILHLYIKEEVRAD